MRLTDRLILKEIIPYFFFGIVTFTSLILGIGAVFKILRLAMDYHTGGVVVVQLFFLKLPEVVTYTLPMSTLFSVLLGFNRMSSDLEITAFRSAGISFPRLVAPAVLFSFFVSLFGLIMNDRVVPLSNYHFGRLMMRAQEKGGVNDGGGMSVFFKNMDEGVLNQIVYAASIEGDVMKGVYYEEFNDGRKWREITARRAKWKRNSWTFHSGKRYEFDETGELTNIVKFKKMDIILLLSPAELVQTQKEPGSLTLRELRERIAFLKKEKIKERDLRKLQVDYHAKIAIPFASLTFALIAAPLGLRPVRASSSIGLGLSVMIIFCYYVAQQIFRVMGQGWLNPAAAAWLPDAVLLVLGAWLILRANR
ncbi:MAG: LptF/LptG family permease [bacterium]